MSLQLCVQDRIFDGAQNPLLGWKAGQPPASMRARGHSRANAACGCRSAQAAIAGGFPPPNCIFVAERSSEKPEVVDAKSDHGGSLHCEHVTHSIRNYHAGARLDHSPPRLNRDTEVMAARRCLGISALPPVGSAPAASLG